MLGFCITYRVSSRATTGFQLFSQTVPFPISGGSSTEELLPNTRFDPMCTSSRFAFLGYLTHWVCLSFKPDVVMFTFARCFVSPSGFLSGLAHHTFGGKFCSVGVCGKPLQAKGLTTFHCCPSRSKRLFQPHPDGCHPHDIMYPSLTRNNRAEVCFPLGHSDTHNVCDIYSPVDWPRTHSTIGVNVRFFLSSGAPRLIVE